MSFNFLILREAIASVSLTHPESCACKTCRAAQGDEQALAEVIDEVTLRMGEDDQRQT